MVPAGTLSDPDAVEEGLIHLELVTGEKVNVNDDGTFTIVESGNC